MTSEKVRPSRWGYINWIHYGQHGSTKNCRQQNYFRQMTCTTDWTSLMQNLKFLSVDVIPQVKNFTSGLMISYSQNAHILKNCTILPFKLYESHTHTWNESSCLDYVLSPKCTSVVQHFSSMHVRYTYVNTLKSETWNLSGSKHFGKGILDLYIGWAEKIIKSSESP